MELPRALVDRSGTEHIGAATALPLTDPRSVTTGSSLAGAAVDTLEQRRQHARTWTVPPSPVASDATPAHLLEGVGETSSDWARLEVVTDVACRLLDAQALVDGLDIEAAARHALAARGLPALEVGVLIQRLTKIGILRETAPGSDSFALAASAAAVAIKMNRVDFLSDELSRIIGELRVGTVGARKQLSDLIAACASATEAWPLYPIEARWPFLKAVALLATDEQKTLVEALHKRPDLCDEPLVDATLLMLEPTVRADWLATFAPRLQGTRVYTLAAEGTYAHGGLGRVQQYHSAAMRELGAHVIGIEPYYAHFTNGEPIDYAKLPRGLRELSTEPVYSFPVKVNGADVQIEVFRGVRVDGVEIYLVRDATSRLTDTCYKYAQDGIGPWEDFTEMMSRAGAEVVARREHDESSKPDYRPAAVIANDGQLAPSVHFLKEMRDAGALPNKVALWEVTHTYKNRGIYSLEDGERIMRRWAIPPEQWSTFRRVVEMDITSGGIRDADGASGVAAVHADENRHIDPSAKLVAITNGDDRRASSKVFRELLATIDPSANADAPTPAQIVAVKRAAKERLGLSPDQPVISYSGRLVGEKAGRERAFTDENLRALVAAGAQVVLYGNVQASTESKTLHEQLTALAEELNAAGLPGRLVVRDGFDTAAQAELLAASDLQVQDSDRRTGASEYTEADVSANGGLQMGPPWIEGIIQRQGVVVDRDHPGRGNTLLPASASPAAYLDAMHWLIEMFRHDPEKLAAYQAASVRLSRVLDARLTAAEYLRQLDGALRRLAEA